jgi:hypothetical protein
MIQLNLPDDLVALHTGNVKESLHLEYKASDAVDKKNDRKKIDMARMSPPLPMLTEGKSSMA